MWPIILAALQMKRQANEKNAALSQDAAKKGQAFTDQQNATADAPNPIQLPQGPGGGGAGNDRAAAIAKMLGGDVSGGAGDLFGATRTGQLFGTMKDIGAQSPGAAPAPGRGALAPGALGGNIGAAAPLGAGQGPAIGAAPGAVQGAGNAAAAARAAAVQKLFSSLSSGGWW